MPSNISVATIHLDLGSQNEYLLGVRLRARCKTLTFVLLCYFRFIDSLSSCQGHDLVMHVLYHLHGLVTTEGEQSPGAAALYEKFLLGVVRIYT